MTLRHFHIFSTVCKKESITKAAEELNMAQPAVSFAIRELESYYGTKLFERMNRRLYITDAGKQLLVYADSVLAQCNEAKDVLSDINAMTKYVWVQMFPLEIVGFKIVSMDLKRFIRRFLFIHRFKTLASSKNSFYTIILILRSWMNQKKKSTSFVN